MEAFARVNGLFNWGISAGLDIVSTNIYNTCDILRLVDMSTLSG